MKKAIVILICSPIFCAAAYAQVALPDAFSSAEPLTQNQICGELLLGLSVEGYKATPVTAQNYDQRIRLVYETGAQAVLALESASALPIKDKIQARAVARDIESLPAPDHIATAMACRNRVEEWIDQGKISMTKLEHAVAQVELMLPKMVQP